MVISYSSMLRFGPVSLIALPLLMLASGGVTLYLIPQPLMQPAPLTLTFSAAVLISIYMIYLAWVIRQRQRGFMELKNRADEQQQRYTMLASNLTKYLSPQVWHSIFAGRKTAKIESQRKKLTIFFSDIKGFTELSEELEAEALTDMLNQYLTEMSRIALKYGGTIDKFVGDSIMIFFGDPKTRGPKKDALAAVSMAIAMRRHMKILRKQWKKQGIERPLQIRMGINTGYCTVGNFGAENRMDYTLIGKEVNLASRLESMADANQILISHETWSLVKDTILCHNQGEVPVKGFNRAVHCYRVLDFRRNLGEKPGYMDFETNGFSIYMDKDNIDAESRKEILQSLQEASKRIEKSLEYEVEALETD
ncbi:adenylate cyclase [Endozoicomonas sp. OPT23]|nr:adenylate cyclase [Endozoicomonas sp. OPT23]